MNEKTSKTFRRLVNAKVARKMKAKRSPTTGVWYGLGMVGLIGWSVVIPMMFGALLGRWIDNKGAGGFIWTLLFLLVGLTLGCISVWCWINKMNREMHKEQE